MDGQRSTEKEEVRRQKEEKRGPTWRVARARQRVAEAIAKEEQAREGLATPAELGQGRSNASRTGDCDKLTLRVFPFGEEQFTLHFQSKASKELLRILEEAVPLPPKAENAK